MWILALVVALVVLVVLSVVAGRSRGWRGDADPGRRIAGPDDPR